MLPPKQALVQRKDKLFVRDVIDIIESAAPLKWQEEWDNSGLQVGNRNAEVKNVLLTTDVTESVVSEAITCGCEMIVSHHPLLFHGLKHICGETPQERCVETAIRHNIAVYSAHTSMDSWLHGVSGRMAERIGIKKYSLLQITDEEHGLGVIGELDEAIPYETLLAKVKSAFEAPALRYIPAVKTNVKLIALCGGAGAEFVEDAIKQGADVFITADVKYHTFLDVNGRIGIIDLDHWVSEHFVRDVFRELLQGKVNTLIATEDYSPVKIY